MFQFVYHVLKKEVINDEGTVNENKLKTMCQRLDKPYYTDELDSAFYNARKNMDIYLMMKLPNMEMKL